jgi:hypothetical protein
MKIPIIIVLMLTMSINTFGQEPVPKTVTSNKGTIYIFWGWNRSWYTDSDIRFTGDNYDFKLNDVKAQDRQSTLGIDPFLTPNRITIPQTNFRVGYFITDKIDISIGVDHMKYIMPNNQTVQITGKIDDGSDYDGTYTNEDIELTKDFLFFEHSDGLNYINAEITRNDDLLQLLKVTMNPDKVQVHTLLGFGIGALMPKSNVTLWNNERNDQFHFAGYGFSAKVGLNVTFFKHFFIRSEYKGGFIDMPDILTSPDPSDKASQHFLFTEVDFIFGFAVNPFSKKAN